MDAMVLEQAGMYLSNLPFEALLKFLRFMERKLLANCLRRLLSRPKKIFPLHD